MKKILIIILGLVFLTPTFSQNYVLKDSTQNALNTLLQLAYKLNISDSSIYATQYDLSQISGVSTATFASMIHDSLNAGYSSSYTGEEIDKAIGNTLYSVIKTNPDSASTVTLLRTKAETIIDSVFTLVQGTSALVDFNLAYGTNRTSGTNVFGSSQSADNVTVGETFTTFSSATIPVNNMIWLNITNTDNTPTEFQCTIYYH